MFMPELRRVRHSQPLPELPLFAWASRRQRDLPPHVRAIMRRGQVTETYARAVVALIGPEARS